MDYKRLTDEVTYTGRELRGGWVRGETGIEGDAAVAFIGPCRVDNADLVDLDDARAGSHIASALMAHVIIEHPGCSLELAVMRQRILVCILCEGLRRKGVAVHRDGDDVYCEDRKLTVSVAAPSPTSAVIHLGINVDPAGAPVAAIGLKEIGIDARGLLDELLADYAKEIHSCKHAESKVRAVP